MTRKKIMIVEDEPVSVLVLAKFIQGLGYELFGNFSAGEDAIEAVKFEKPDLILMDIGLLGTLNGMETAEKIENMRKDISIIYVTGLLDNRDTINVMKKNKWFKGFVSKPFSHPMLEEMIKKALE